MMFFTKYTVTYWDEIDEKTRVATGIACGETLLENTRRITEYYGDNRIDELAIYVVEETECGVWEDGRN